MFLAFTDAHAVKPNLENNLIGSGKHLSILFAISLQGTRHQCQVQARIIRVTQRGIGVEFGEHFPWQLAELIELFSRAYPETAVARS